MRPDMYRFVYAGSMEIFEQKINAVANEGYRLIEFKVNSSAASSGYYAMMEWDA